MPDGCWGVEFSADSKSLVIGDGAGTLHWVSTSTWETEWTYKVGTSQINTIRISPSGDWLDLGTESGQLAIFDLSVRTVRHQVQAHSERIWSLDVSPDGQRVATGSSDTRVKTWDPDSGQLLLTHADYSDAIYHVRFSPNGASLFVNCLGGKIVQLKAIQDQMRR